MKTDIRLLPVFRGGRVGNLTPYGKMALVIFGLLSSARGSIADTLAAAAVVMVVIDDVRVLMLVCLEKRSANDEIKSTWVSVALKIPLLLARDSLDFLYSLSAVSPALLSARAFLAFMSKVKSEKNRVSEKSRRWM